MKSGNVKKNPIAKFFGQSFTVLWSDLRFLRRFWKRTLWTSLMTPLLYLLAFGVGISSMVEMDGGGSYLAFVIPGIIAITAMTTAYNASGNKLSVDKIFYKSFDEVIMAPLSIDTVAFGKGMVGVLRGVLACGLFIILGMLMAPSEFTVNWPFFAALILSLLAFSFMGVAVGVIAKTHQDMSTFSSIFIMPMTFLCGTLFDPAVAPQWLQVFLYSLPLTHSSTAMRAAVDSGEVMWWSLAYMLIFAIICYIIARWQIKKLDF